MARRRQPPRLRRADREGATTGRLPPLHQRFEVAGHALDGPRIGGCREMPRGMRRRLVEKLMHRFVRDRARVLALADKKMRLPLRVEINSQRDLDLRLPPNE